MDHLSTILNNGTPVHVDLRGFIAPSGVEGREEPKFWGREATNKRVPGVITKAHVPLNKPDLSEKDIEYVVCLCEGYQWHSAFCFFNETMLNRVRPSWRLLSQQNLSKGTLAALWQYQ